MLISSHAMDRSHAKKTSISRLKMQTIGCVVAFISRQFEEW